MKQIHITFTNVNIETLAGFVPADQIDEELSAWAMGEAPLTLYMEDGDPDMVEWMKLGADLGTMSIVSILTDAEEVTSD